MEQIEGKRKQMLGARYDRTRRLIIPVMLRYEHDNIPQKIKEIQYVDFSDFALQTLELTKNPSYREAFDNIAFQIYHHSEDLKDLKENCDSFVLPCEQDAIQSWAHESRDIGMPGGPIP
jgi:hypothetical protein